MKNIFLKDNIIKGNIIILNNKESNHLMNSLRYKIGDEIIVSDELEKEYFTVIQKYSDGHAFLEILEERPLKKKDLKISLVQGLCKGEKMDFIIQKATELGIGEIIPLETARTVIKLDTVKAAKKTERWQKIALEAAKQCGSPEVTKIRDVITLKDFLKTMTGEEVYLLFWEKEKETGLKETLQSLKPLKLVLIIGPEGGFDENEAARLKESGALSVSLGERILRTETAAIVSAACAMYHYGDLG